jgi:hypothetical protein
MGSRRASRGAPYRAVRVTEESVLALMTAEAQGQPDREAEAA